METTVHHQRDLVTYTLVNWKPVQFIREHRRMVILRFEGEDDKSGCCIKNALKPLGDSKSGTNENTIAIGLIHKRCHERMN